MSNRKKRATTKRPSGSSTWDVRAPERALLGLVFGAVVCGYGLLLLIKLAQTPRLQVIDLVPPVVFGLALIVSHLWLVGIRYQGDCVVLPAALFLGGIGLLTQLRLRSYALDDPAHLANYAFPVGVLLMLLTITALGKGRYRVLRHASLPALLVSAGILGAVVVFGRRFRGAVFLPGNVNPTEIVKVLLVVFLAGFLVPHRKNLDRTVMNVPSPPMSVLLTFAILWSIPMGLLVVQRDLGLIVLLNAVCVVMLFTLTRRWSYILSGVAWTGLLAGAMFVLAAHSQRRLAAWYDPFRDPTGAGWQVLQGLSAMYSGGLWGLGLGVGSPQSIPIASSDFVYAVIGEELGFMGCGLVIVAYLLLFHRGFRVAWHARDDFARLLSCGVIAALTIQTLLNLAGVTKAAPLTGVTLPFISYGGSSLITSFVSLGLLMAVADDMPVRAPPKPKAKPKAKARPVRRAAKK